MLMQAGCSICLVDLKLSSTSLMVCSLCLVFGCSLLDLCWRDSSPGFCYSSGLWVGWKLLSSLLQAPLFQNGLERFPVGMKRWTILVHIFITLSILKCRNRNLGQLPLALLSK